MNQSVSSNLSSRSKREGLTLSPSNGSIKHQQTGTGSIATAEVVTTPVVIAQDDRGVIEQLAKGDFQSVLRTTQIKGSIRANHYHKHDSHLGYLVSGKLQYMTRPADDEQAKLTEYTITPGQLFYTPPMVAHATVALEDSDVIYFTPRSGEAGEYENDVIRVELISAEAAKALAEQA